MAGKKGARNIKGMRHRRKGGNDAKDDGFDRSSPDTIASLADEWLLQMQQRAYSAGTLRSNLTSLKSFLTWCGERGLSKPEQITKPTLESYQRWIFRYRKKDGKPLGVTTQRHRLGSVQRLFAWLCRENLLSANPAADLELPRMQERLLPKALTRDEIASLFAIPDPRDVLGLRDRCILEVFYSCGLRRAELARINIEDIELSQGVLTVVKGKGGKSRTVPLGGRTADWLMRYLDKSRPQLDIRQTERALFLSGYGERFSPGYLGNWVKRLMRSVDIIKEGSCHLLRHSCATHMLENGADIRFIQQLLGHAKMDTTSIYTQVSIVQLREVHARTHPHAQKEG